MRRPEHVSVVARDVDPELARIRDAIERTVLVEDRGELEAQLGQLAIHADRRPRTLDLIGHSTPPKSLLCLGDWLIDTRRSPVVSFFRGLADAGVLDRLGIEAIRLLGCETASTPEGRATICRLAEVTGVDVLGTRDSISAADYDAHGFRDDREHALVSARELLDADPDRTAIAQARAYRRMLDVEILPAVLPGEHRGPVRLADREAARTILAMIRRADGAYMPGLRALPSHVVALPALRTGAFHLLEVLLDGTFVRVHPDGASEPGVVFPVTEARALLQLVEALPAGSIAR